MINAIGIPLKCNAGELQERNDSLIKAAYLYDVPIFLYNFSDIENYQKNGYIEALYWDKGDYHSCKIDLPRFTEIYCGTSDLKARYPAQFKWLEENTVFTDGFGLSKLRFQLGLQSSELGNYAIPTFPVQSFDSLMAALKGLPVSFLKPAGGRKAKGTMKIENIDGNYFYSTPENSGLLTQEVFADYYAEAGFSENAMLLLEPCLNILNDNGRAVDFRCLVSLNGEGKWQNVLTYARIGGTGVASNFSHGGSLNFAEDVLEELIPGHGKEKLDEINDVALKAAEFVRQKSVNNVSWLGLDICVDRPSNQVYVIEANSKPGTKLVGPWPLALVRAQYFKYILENGIPEK